MRKLIGKYMSSMNWLALVLFTATMTAVAQQPASAPQSGQPQSSPAAANLAAPTTMDQVVDRVVLREKDLIKFLSPRTPVVETYLQNLTQDPQLGPIPQDDHYFLGRMDFSASIDRSDYLQDEKKKKDKEEGMEQRLLGGFTKKF